MFNPRKICNRVSHLARQWEAVRSGARCSYAQMGEDLLIESALSLLGIERPKYLDIGAHHATSLSNTFYFYARGGSGVCVEPNPRLCEQIKAARPRDVCLNIGISTGGARPMSFYVLDIPTLSTFDEQVARRCVEHHGHQISETIEVPVMPVSQVINRYMPTAPNLVSLDTEGHDLPILSEWDFVRFRPEVFCIETLEYDPAAGGRKLLEIGELMLGHGYFVYADTYINTIFVDEERWRMHFNK